MPILQLDSENADRNLTSSVTVLTHTPDASNPVLCQGLVMLGDGAKDLDGSGGDFELVITVGGQTIQPSPQTVAFGTEARSSVWTTVFPVPANAEVVLKAKSPNGADTDVGVTAYLFDVLPNDISVAEIGAATIEGAISRLEKERIELSALGAKSTGGGTDTLAFRDQADAKNRIEATVDANGNRTAVTLDGS